MNYTCLYKEHTFIHLLDTSYSEHYLQMYVCVYNKDSSS